MPHRGLFTLLLAFLTSQPVVAATMVPLDDDDMAEVSGAGIAIAFDDFEVMMAPTSYFEQVGAVPADACTSGGAGTGNQDCWRRGDLRWYGGNLSGVGAGGSHWNESSCNASSLACPRGGVISHFAPFDNPYLIRAWSPPGMGFDGSCINADDGLCSGPPTVKSVYEFLAPTNQPDYTMSFWGEIETGRVQDPADPWNQQLGYRYGLLKSQTIIRGNAAGSIFRAFQFTDPANPTLGLMYHSRLQGDFRFSVAQNSTGATSQVGAPPVFEAQEGLHFIDVEAYIPLGQPYYQALLINAVGTSGGFSLELPMIPDQVEVYSKFYGLRPGDDLGYETARLALLGDATDDYRLSHGFSRWGDWFMDDAAGTRNSRTSTDSGIFFRACATCGSFNAYASRPVRIDVRSEQERIDNPPDMMIIQNYTSDGSDGPGPTGSESNGQILSGTVVNLGDARIEGILIQSFNMTTCSAGPGIC